MKRICWFLLVVIMFYLPINVFAQLTPVYKNWLADDPQTQLDKEGIDDEKGLGRIFVPAMSRHELEPEFFIMQNKKIIKYGCRIGESIFLKPGKYTLLLGSGIMDDQKVKKVFTLAEGETKIIYPNWSGLIVKIIDQSRNFLRESYEIYDVKTYQSLGMKYSADEDEPGEYQSTWLLKPGLYKIVKYGEPFNTFTNFTTILLLPGELTTMTVVISNTTGNFVGSGILPEMEEIKKTQTWNVYTSLKGSFLLSSDNTASKENNETNITLSSRLENEIKHDKYPHYFSSKQILNLGLNKEESKDFRIYSNDIQVSPTYIFYFVKRFGVYTRFRIDTKPLASKYYFDSKQDTVYKYDEDGNIIEVFTDVKEVQTAPMFFPMRFEEGIGINITLLKKSRSNLSIKSGLGLSQTINSNVFEQNLNDSKRFDRLGSVHLKGIEGSLTGDFRIAANLTYFGEVYTLYPFEKDRTPVIRWENIFTIRITRYISLDYTISLNRDETKDWVVQKHNLSIDFTIIKF